jgi:hypothetical protein
LALEDIKYSTRYYRAHRESLVQKARERYVTHRERINAARLETRRALKLEMVALLGGACVLCGYDKHPAALDFDHIDPKTKTKGVAQLLMSRSREKIIEEVRKCRLLCANCHREETWVKEGYV